MCSLELTRILNHHRYSGQAETLQEVQAVTILPILASHASLSTARCCGCLYQSLWCLLGQSLMTRQMVPASISDAGDLLVSTGMGGTLNYKCQMANQDLQNGNDPSH